MPEPESKDVEEDIYSRDIDDPYMIPEGGGPPNLKLHLLFSITIISIGGIIGLGLFPFHFGSMQIADSHHRWAITYMRGAYSMFGFIGGLRMCGLGFAPNCHSWRSTVWSGMFMPMQMKNAATGSYEINSSCHEFRWGKFAYGGMLSFGNHIQSLSLVGFFACHIVKNRHAYGNTYGRYCCYSFPRMRLARTMLILVTFVSLRWFCNAVLFSLGGRSGVAQSATVQFMFPLLVFAWKRFTYVILVTGCGDDHPNKHYLAIPMSIIIMMVINFSNAAAAIGANEWLDVINFVVIDWLLFFLRMGLCLRIGFKTCPKLLEMLLKKQLENVLTPMARARAASGDKTSIRVQQAFFCLIEGETLTVCYSMLLLNYLMCLICGPYFQHMMEKIVPMKTVVHVFVFAFLDLLQDILGDRALAKFSEWTYLYRGVGKGKGYHGSTFLPYVAVGYIMWGEENWFLGLRMKEVQIRMKETKGGNFPGYTPIHMGAGSTIFLAGY